MARELIIRKAVREDIPAIVELWKELMDMHQELDRIFTMSASGSEVFAKFVEENISGEDSCVVVAGVQGSVVGYGQAKLEKHPPALKETEYGLILDFFVAEAYRGKEIGGELVKEIRKWFLVKGVRRIEVRHSTHNEIAARFWSKMGFRPYLKTLFMELQQGEDKSRGLHIAVEKPIDVDITD